MIEKLTPEQEALIPVYREKWRRIALSTEPIDREKAAEAVKKAYALIGLEEPEIIFYDSPYAVSSDRQLVIDEQRIYGELYKNKSISQKDFISYFYSSTAWNWRDEILSHLSSKLQDELLAVFLDSLVVEIGDVFVQIMQQLWNQLWEELSDKVSTVLEEWCNQLNIPIPNEKRLHWVELSRLASNEPDGSSLCKEWNNICRQSDKLEIIYGDDGDDYNFIYSYEWARQVSLYEFCINVLNCGCSQNRWEVLQAIAKNCSWILPFEKLVIICDRPRILYLDNQNRLNAEGSPAIEFADGYSLYSYHGVTLPEEYGKLHPKEWQAKWLLEEKNAELRRVLIQGIGYSRISDELGATELDSYREYTLLKIDSDIDDEPINLLKMTCPSTGYIHVLRVPPDVESAKDAIAWVNWGIYPEEFGVQT